MVPSDGETGQSRRSALVERETTETKISLRLTLDGAGQARVATGIGFFDHMLDLLARHGGFDLDLEADGDLETGPHHTVEDVAICLGQALEQAWGDKRGVSRYASIHLPMDEALVLVVLDLSGRPLLVWDVALPAGSIGGFDTDLLQEFLQALVNHARVTLHVRSLSGTNAHHLVEAVFKGLGRALAEAARVSSPAGGVPSTKGVL